MIRPALLALACALLVVPAYAKGSHAGSLPSLPHVKAQAVPRAPSGRIARSPAEKHAFMKASPCPGGPDAGSTSRCRGYVVDHVKPLACGGPDAPSNMAWQTAADGRAKDKIERKGC